MSFRQQVDAAGNTQPWNLSFVEGSAQGLSIPSGTMYLHTLGTSANTTIGWGAITGAVVTAYAIFTQRVPGRQDQDGTVPGGFGAPGFLVPFDDAAPVYAESGSPILGLEAPMFSGFPSSWFIKSSWPASGNTEWLLIRFFCTGDTCLVEIFQPPDSFTQKPFLWATFECDVQGQTLTSSQYPSLSGFYSTSPISAAGLTLTMSNFAQTDASVTGNLTLASGPAIISGPLTGTATYLP